MENQYEITITGGAEPFAYKAKSYVLFADSDTTMTSSADGKMSAMIFARQLVEVCQHEPSVRYALNLAMGMLDAADKDNSP